MCSPPNAASAGTGTGVPEAAGCLAAAACDASTADPASAAPVAAAVFSSCRRESACGCRWRGTSWDNAARSIVLITMCLPFARDGTPLSGELGDGVLESLGAEDGVGDRG